jgi:hypothetical protein
VREDLPDPEQLWWKRVRLAAKGRGREDDKIMSDWSHDMLEVVSGVKERTELVGPFGHRRWQPIPPERCTEEYKQAETRRLLDQLGRRLGIGPMPR